MKVAIINFLSYGGAAKAAKRLNDALNANGVDSRMLIIDGQESETITRFEDFSIIERLSRFYPKSYKQNKYESIKHRLMVVNSFPECVYDITRHPIIRQADVVNLHWVGEMINYKSFFRKIKKPIVWTLHDMNPFMGFVHYKYDLLRYPEYTEMDQRVGALKAEWMSAHDNVNVVALCEWMRRHSEGSQVLGTRPHHIIPNSLDTDTFRLYDRRAMRARYGFDERPVLMFCSEFIHDKRKGFDLLLEATKMIKSDVQYIVIGNVAEGLEIPDNFRCYGVVSDETEMARLYSCADLFLLPSREDNLPNTMVESLCCGTPVVSFANGGMRENIQDMTNGYIVDRESAADLAEAVDACIANIRGFDNEKISDAAVRKFAPSVQASAYIDLFDRIINH